MAVVWILATAQLCASVVFRKDFPLDAQTRWQSIVASRASLAAVAADRAGNIYLAGSSAIGDLPVLYASQPAIASASLVRSNNGGRTWAPLPIPSVALYPPAIHLRTPATLLVSGVYGIYRSTDAGQTWRTVLDLNDRSQRVSVGYVDHIQYDPTDPNRAYAGATGCVLRTLDGGATWTLLTAGLAAGNCCTGAPLFLDPARPGRLLYSINERAYVSDDRGDSWRLLRLPEHDPAVRLVPDPFRANTWYLSSYAAAWITEDAGNTWTHLPLESRLLYDLLPDPAAEGVLVAQTAEGLRQSPDRGRTWKPLPVPAGAQSFQFDPVNHTRWYASSYFSDDRGTTWRPLNQPREMEFTTDPANPQRIYAGGNSATDAWLAKYSPQGDLLFATWFGGQGNDTPASIAVDAAGTIWIAGLTDSTDLPAQTRRFGSASAPFVFVARFDSAGTPLQAATFGGDAHSRYGSLGLGPDGAAHLLFYTRAEDLPVSPGAIAPESGQVPMAYYARLSTAGDLLFSSYLGLAFSETLSLAVDRTGAAWIGGTLRHPSFLRVPAPLWPPAENGDAGLLKFSPAGDLLLAARPPASVEAVAVDDAGEIYIGGTATINDPLVLPETAYQRTIDTSCPHNSGVYSPRRPWFMTDVWFAHLDPGASSIAGATLFGGSCLEKLEDLAIAPDGTVILAGQGYSDPLPATDPIARAPDPGDKRLFLAQFAPDGSSLLHSTHVQPGRAGRIAASGDGVVLAADPTDENPAALWKIAFGPRPPFSITGIRNAFLSTNTAVAPNTIVTITVAGLPDDLSVYLGLAPPGGAPYEIGGITVTFDGLAAPLLGVRPGEITAVVPPAVRAPGMAPLTIRTATGAQATLYIETVESLPALYPDIRNADGTLNAPDNPSISGTPITVFLTGIPPSFATTLRVQETGQEINIAEVRPVPGFVTGLYYAVIPAPEGNGLRTLTLPGRPQSSARISVRTPV